MNFMVEKHKGMSIGGWGFPLLIGVIVECVFIVGALGGGMPATIVGVLFLAMYCCVAPIEKAFLVFLLTIPNQRMVVLGESTISLLNLVVCVLLVRVCSSSMRRNFLFWVVSSLMGSLSLLVFFQNGSWIGIVLFVKVWMEFLLFTDIFKKRVGDSNWFWLCTIFYVVGGLLMGVAEVLAPSDEVGIGRLGMDSGFNGPNMMGNRFSFGIAMLLLVLTVYVIRVVPKITLAGCALGLLCLGLLTASRAFLLSLSSVCAGYLLCSAFSISRWKIMLSMLGAFTGVILFAICFPDSPLGQIWDYLIARIENPRGGDVSNGRLSIWAGYWEVYTSSFGNIMWGTSGDPRIYGMEATHNAYLSTLVGWGILGTTFFLVALFSLFRELYVEYKVRYGKPTLLGAMCVCLLLLNWMTLTNLTDMNAIACMFLSLCALFVEGMGKQSASHCQVITYPNLRKIK